MIDFDEFAADLLDSDAFGQTATYIPVGGLARNITVIFHAPGAVAVLAGGAGFETASPWVACKTLDVVVDVTHGATVMVDGVNYKVVGVSHDGTGLTVLTLSEHSDV